ncbi:hypothetical protein NI401_00405 [Acinetobacter indicus]|uniref:hypothetical protein n=1 Tax=Acinetobacter indicus TaxID=756892 RepID=UPI00209A77E3|nr:hypothetical protein [Acinetobacter indicus]MCO8101400.1 hypothetical protein [Acinetobacter indicus]
MKLEELQEKLIKEHSYSSIYRIYFEIETNSKYFPFKRIAIIIVLTIFLVIFSNFIPLPKLENETLYIFAAQVTIIALIFPIILTLIGILYSKKNDFDSIYKIYIANTNAKTLYRGSFITLLFYVISFFYLYDSSLSEQIRRALNVTLAITFIDALIVTLFFLEKTISFTTTQGTNEIFLKYYINSNTNDESINILSIISNRLNEDIKNNDLNTFEKNLEFFMKFIDIIIITSTKQKDNIISSDLHKTMNNDLFSTKFSKIISLIEANIKNSIEHTDRHYYQNIKSIYFYIFYRNSNHLEEETIYKLITAHYHQCYLITNQKTDQNPKIINDYISSWYKWIKPYKTLEPNTLFFIFKNHLTFTLQIIDYFSKEKNLRGLDYFCDCLSRWESEAKDMPNYLQPNYHLQTIHDEKNIQNLANFVSDTKFIAFYLVQKKYFDIQILSKYYKVLIKGATLFKTIDLRSNSYSFKHLDDLLFCYLRLLKNTEYEYFFNDILENSDRAIEITGLIHGGWIPKLESRITHLTIQLLLIENSKKLPNTYQWKEALGALSIAKIGDSIDIFQKIKKQIECFDDYKSLHWDEKKLSLAKVKTISYIEKVLEIANEINTAKFNSIELDDNKVKNQISDNTFYLKDIKNCLNESEFSIFISNKIISYKTGIQNSTFYDSLPSKYLTSDYDIHIDSRFKPSYYTLLIDSSIYQALNQDKHTEYYCENDISKLLLKILLRSYIFASPTVLFNHPKILNFMLHSAYRKTDFPHQIQSKENNKYFKVGRTIFKYVYNLPIENTAYIIGSHTIENITLEKVTPETLSSVSVNLNPNDLTKADIRVLFPIEVALTKNTQIIEIIMPD